jgi:hypothetical protein
MESGELPNDEGLVGTMIKNICFENARQFLRLEIPAGVPQKSERIVQS